MSGAKQRVQVRMTQVYVARGCIYDEAGRETLLILPWANSQMLCDNFPNDAFHFRASDLWGHLTHQSDWH